MSHSENILEKFVIPKLTVTSVSMPPCLHLATPYPQHYPTLHTATSYDKLQHIIITWVNVAQLVIFYCRTWVNVAQLDVTMLLLCCNLVALCCYCVVMLLLCCCYIVATWSHFVCSFSFYLFNLNSSSLYHTVTYYYHTITYYINLLHTIHLNTIILYHTVTYYIILLSHSDKMSLRWNLLNSFYFIQLFNILLSFTVSYFGYQTS